MDSKQLKELLKNAREDGLPGTPDFTKIVPGTIIQTTGIFDTEKVRSEAIIGGVQMQNANGEEFISTTQNFQVPTKTFCFVISVDVRTVLELTMVHADLLVAVPRSSDDTCNILKLMNVRLDSPRRHLQFFDVNTDMVFNEITQLYELKHKVWMVAFETQKHQTGHKKKIQKSDRNDIIATSPTSVLAWFNNAVIRYNNCPEIEALDDFEFEVHNEDFCCRS